jgi:hypothetical protein
VLTFHYFASYEHALTHIPEVTHSCVTQRSFSWRFASRTSTRVRHRCTKPGSLSDLSVLQIAINTKTDIARPHAISDLEP